MISVTTELVPDQTRVVRVYDGKPGKSKPYRALLHFTDKGEGEVHAWGIVGSIDNECNLAIAKAAIDLGFTRLTGEVPKGKPMSRYVTHTHSDEHFDYYAVDLSALGGLF